MILPFQANEDVTSKDGTDLNKKLNNIENPEDFTNDKKGFGHSSPIRNKLIAAMTSKMHSKEFMSSKGIKWKQRENKKDSAEFVSSKYTDLCRLSRSNAKQQENDEMIFFNRGGRHRRGMKSQFHHHHLPPAPLTSFSHSSPSSQQQQRQHRDKCDSPSVCHDANCQKERKCYCVCDCNEETKELNYQIGHPNRKGRRKGENKEITAKKCDKKHDNDNGGEEKTSFLNHSALSSMSKTDFEDFIKRKNRNCKPSEMNSLEKMHDFLHRRCKTTLDAKSVTSNPGNKDRIPISSSLTRALLLDGGKSSTRPKNNANIANDAISQHKAELIILTPERKRRKMKQNPFNFDLSKDRSKTVENGSENTTHTAVASSKNLGTMMDEIKMSKSIIDKDLDEMKEKSFLLEKDIILRKNELPKKLLKGTKNSLQSCIATTEKHNEKGAFDALVTQKKKMKMVVFGDEYLNKNITPFSKEMKSNVFANENTPVTMVRHKRNGSLGNQLSQAIQEKSNEPDDSKKDSDYLIIRKRKSGLVNEASEVIPSENYSFSPLEGKINDYSGNRDDMTKVTMLEANKNNVFLENPSNSSENNSFANRILLEREENRNKGGPYHIRLDGELFQERKTIPANFAKESLTAPFVTSNFKGHNCKVNDENVKIPKDNYKVLDSSSNCRAQRFLPFKQCDKSTSEKTSERKSKDTKAPKNYDNLPQNNKIQVNNFNDFINSSHTNPNMNTSILLPTLDTRYHEIQNDKKWTQKFCCDKNCYIQSSLNGKQKLTKMEENMKPLVDLTSDRNSVVQDSKETKEPCCGLKSKRAQYSVLLNPSIKSGALEKTKFPHQTNSHNSENFVESVENMDYENIPFRRAKTDLTSVKKRQKFDEFNQFEGSSLLSPGSRKPIDSSIYYPLLQTKSFSKSYDNISEYMEDEKILICDAKIFNPKKCCFDSHPSRRQSGTKREVDQNCQERYDHIVHNKRRIPDGMAHMTELCTRHQYQNDITQQHRLQKQRKDDNNRGGIMSPKEIIPLDCEKHMYKHRKYLRPKSDTFNVIFCTGTTFVTIIVYTTFYVL